MRRCLPKEWLTPHALEATLAESRETNHSNSGLYQLLQTCLDHDSLSAFDATSQTGLTASSSAERDLQSPTMSKLKSEFAKSFLQPKQASNKDQ